MLLKKILKKIQLIYRKKKILKSNWFKEMSILEKKILHLGTPEHGNLGDHMIAISGNQFLKDHYQNYKLYEITLNEYELIKKELKFKINEDDIIYFIGGGHFGTLYLHHELRRREIIENYPKNEIIFLPTTMTYTGKNWEEELEKSKETYIKHSKLTIMCREKESFNFAKKEFKNKILLVPDMVNYLEGQYKKESIIKSKVLFLIRKDKEKISDNNIFDELIKILKKNKISYDWSDTHLGDEISIDKNYRKNYIDKLLAKINQSEIIITDRLHGMILGIILKKSVIAFNSLDGKVKKSYLTWYKEYENVLFNDETELFNQLKIVSNKKKEKKNITREKLIKIIRGREYE